MSERIVVDPITRIEGHLRIEVEVDDNNVVQDAWSSISLWRGLEVILQGRDPRDAGLLTQRFCGVCTYSHYETSVMACEDAFGIKPPPNARIIRNLIKASQYLTDHIMHFYHLHGLDWVDVVSALSANPAAAVALAQGFHATPYNCSVENYTAVQARIQTFVDSGRLGPFANAYWGNTSYKLTPEANLVILSHYLDALNIAKVGGQMQAIFGGKNPHPQTLVIGGVTCVEDMLDSARVDSFLAKLLAVKSFIDTAYIPDILIAADGYQDEGLAGVGSGVTNFLCYGGFPLDDDWNTTLLPRGVILGGDLSSPQPLDESMITEAVTHAWYEGSSNLHPYDGETLPDYTGFDVDGHLQGDGKYSWCKAPRYDNLPFEVGPLARFLVGYAQGQSEIVTLVDDTLAAAGLPVTALFSSLGRTAARALETKLIADHVNGWVAELLANINAGDTCYIATAAGGRGDTSTWTPHTIPGGPVQGRWLNEVPRGALGHWVKIDGGVIDKYQAVVPSTWNCSPRDGGGQRGPYEESLIGLELADRTQPLEILRTIHSFDPCMACAVHIIDPRTKEVSRFKVL